MKFSLKWTMQTPAQVEGHTVELDADPHSADVLAKMLIGIEDVYEVDLEVQE